jgi:hypothetical protein
MLHSFVDIPDRLREFLERMTSQYLESITERQALSKEPPSKINELKELIYPLPHASHELKRLLRMYPSISLQDQANLLYYLRTDLTDCDVDNLEYCVGWRIPQVTSLDCKVAMRFTNLLPPLFRQHRDERPTRSPWKVNLAEDQVELVGFIAYSSIQLYGVVMPTTYDSSPGAVLQYFKIYEPPQFNEALLYSDQSRQLFSHEQYDSLSGPMNSRVIRFERPFELLETTKYVFKFKLAGSPAFYHGNSKSHQELTPLTDSDGVVLHFTEVFNISREYVSRTKQGTGPLLGLLYK